MITQQMTPFFYLPFDLYLMVYFIFAFQDLQNSHWISCLGKLLMQIRKFNLAIKKKNKIHKMHLNFDIGLALFRMGGRGAQEGPPPTSFSSVNSLNVGISPQNLLTFISTSFATLV